MTGPCVLLTRSDKQNAPLQKKLSDAGITTEVCPLQAIQPVELKDEDKQKVINLDRYDLIVFVSPNAVHHGFKWVEKYWPKLPLSLKWFAIGAGTGKELEQKGVNCTYPSAGSSEALLEFMDLQMAQGKVVLIVRGLGGRELLKSELEQRGARVEYLEVYQRLKAKIEPDVFGTMMIKKEVRVVVIVSGEVLKEFFTLVARQSTTDAELAESHELLELIVPSDRIGVIAKEMGFKNIHVSRGAETEAMFSTITGVLADVY